MTITQIQIGDTFHSLAEGELVEIKEGDTIRVYFSFRGRVPVKTEVSVWASVYHMVAGFVNRQEWAQSKGITTLEASGTFVDYSTTIDIHVTKPITSGEFGLLLEFPDYDLSDMTGACLYVYAPPSILDMIPLLIVVMMMSMMMNMMSGAFESTPAPE